MTDIILDLRVEIPEGARAKALSMGSAATHATARLGRVGMTAQGREQALALLLQIAEDALTCRRLISEDIAREAEEARKAAEAAEAS